MNIGSGNPHEGIRLPMFFYLPQASVCLAVVTFQHLLDVALAVERLAAEQEIGQYPLVRYCCKVRRLTCSLRAKSLSVR